MLASIVAMKIWCPEHEGEVLIRAEAFTDNLGNQFILQRGMSTKFPLTLLVMEASMMMRQGKFFAQLEWVNRERNQEADDLTNLEFKRFSHEKRVKIEGKDIRWIVLDQLMKSSQQMYQEKLHRKEERKKLKMETTKGRKKKTSKKFFTKWGA